MATNCSSCANLDIQLVDTQINGYCRYDIDENCFYEYDDVTVNKSDVKIDVRRC